MTEQEKQIIIDEIIEVLKDIYDPEIPVNIYDLGLVYGIDLDNEGNVEIIMTLTSPMCPVAESLPGEVRNAVRFVEGAEQVTVKIVWEPPWDADKMSEEARLMLDMM